MRVKEVFGRLMLRLIFGVDVEIKEDKHIKVIKVKKGNRELTIVRTWDYVPSLRMRVGYVLKWWEKGEKKIYKKKVLTNQALKGITEEIIKKFIKGRSIELA